MSSRIVSELRTPQEFAAELGVSVHSVRRWIRNGDIDCVRTPKGRVAGIPLDAIRALRTNSERRSNPVRGERERQH